jgi:uncharacterized membrane protein
MAERPIRPIARHRIYPTLLPIPIICFIGLLLTDVGYVRSGGNLLWLNFSNWLVAVGLLFGAIAGLVFVIDLIRDAGLRSNAGWAHFGLALAAWVVEFFNALVHSRDGWTAVVSAGLILSIIGVVLVLASGWVWQSIRYRAAGEAA